MTGRRVSVGAAQVHPRRRPRRRRKKPASASRRPFYTQGTNNGRGHFAAFHLRGTHIDAADVSWLPNNPSPPLMDGKDLWTGKTLADLRFQTTTTFADGWGGWAFSKDIDMHACAARDAGASGASPDGSPKGSTGLARRFLHGAAL